MGRYQAGVSGEEWFLEEEKWDAVENGKNAGTGAEAWAWA